MAEIKFTSKGKEHTMLLDEEDLPKFEHMNLRVSKDGYARTTIHANQLKILNETFGLGIEPKYKKGTNTVSIETNAHRIIMGATDSKIQVDHINGNKLDNRKQNLRICTHEQNMWNRGPLKNNKSGYKGVGWSKREKKYQVVIQANNKQVWIGYFDDLKRAARAYDRAAIQYGSPGFIYLNFPEEWNYDEVTKKYTPVSKESNKQA